LVVVIFGYFGLTCIQADTNLSWIFCHFDLYPSRTHQDKSFVYCTLWHVYVSVT